MKIIQSFWSGNQTDITNAYGWHSCKYNWMSWILSCHQLVKYHKDVELYTDAFGYDILIKKLQLPYTKVHVVLDELNQYHKDLWAIAKIRTFAMQTEPFLHVDGDVYVWESLTDKFENSNLIVQNLEKTTGYYRKMWDDIVPHLSFLPNEILDYNDNKNNLACNMGIIGGTNLSFFKNFCLKSTDFVDKNKAVWSSINGFNFNIFFEQVLFFEFLNRDNQSVDSLFQEILLDNDYIGFADFDKVPQKSYLHMIGIYKRKLIACRAMETYVMKYYSEKYSILMKLLNENVENATEIDYLNPSKIVSLINQFDAELKSSNFSSNNFLLKRDLYNEGLPNKLDKLLIDKLNFIVIKLIGLRKIETENESDTIEIDELIHLPSFYQLDEIDNIILSELSEPIQYFDFIKRLKYYFEDDEKDAVEEFLNLINQRLRNYLILKIISIY